METYFYIGEHKNILKQNTKLLDLSININRCFTKINSEIKAPKDLRITSVIPIFEYMRENCYQYDFDNPIHYTSMTIANAPTTRNITKIPQHITKINVSENIREQCIYELHLHHKKNKDGSNNLSMTQC